MLNLEGVSPTMMGWWNSFVRLDMRELHGLLEKVPVMRREAAVKEIKTKIVAAPRPLAEARKILGKALPGPVGGTPPRVIHKEAISELPLWWLRVVKYQQPGWQDLITGAMEYRTMEKLRKLPERVWPMVLWAAVVGRKPGGSIDEAVLIMCKRWEGMREDTVTEVGFGVPRGLSRHNKVVNLFVISVATGIGVPCLALHVAIQKLAAFLPDVVFDFAGLAGYETSDEASTITRKYLEMTGNPGAMQGGLTLGREGDPGPIQEGPLTRPQK